MEEPQTPERPSEQDEFGRLIEYLNNRQAWITDTHTDTEEADEALWSLCEEVNPQLVQSGHIGSGAIIQEGALEFAPVDEEGNYRPDELPQSFHPVMGGYMGVCPMGGELVHVVDKTGNKVEPAIPDRYTYVPIASQSLMLLNAPLMNVPENATLPNIRSATAENALARGLELWKEAKEAAFMSRSTRVIDRFMDEIEKQLRAEGIIRGQRVSCHSDRTYFNDDKDQLTVDTNEEEEQIRGEYLGLVIMPKVHERQSVTGTEYWADRSLAEAWLTVVLYDGEKVIKVPAKPDTDLRPVTGKHKRDA
jgi:hypothetical protein